MRERRRLNSIFASDNTSGVHSKILKAVNAATKGHVAAYGDDPYTRAAVRKFHRHFGGDVDVYFVFGGTGANVLALKAITEPYHAVICAEKAHINVDECGAPEKFIGCKLLPISSDDGKISIDDIKESLNGIGDEHHVQPRVISISQSTEMGTVYTAREIAALANFAHRRKMLLHMDGARIANAAASLNVELREITSDVGVDVLSFGGAKNGMMYGEAVVFFNRRFAQGFKYIRKQGTQLASKMRFIAAQFDALLSDDLWKQNARHANRMAKSLASELKKFSHIKIVPECEANAVFAVLPMRSIKSLQKQYCFYVWHVWNEKTSQVRFMTSFDTTKEDIKNLVGSISGTFGYVKPTVSKLKAQTKKSRRKKSEYKETRYADGFTQC